MRIALLAAAILLAAVPSLPSTSAGLPDYVCIPPGTLNQACVGHYPGTNELCAWPNGPSSFGPVCIETQTTQLLPVCFPPSADNHGCIGIRSDGAACAWIYGGPLYHYACVTRDGHVESCSTNLYATIYGPGWHCLGEPLP